MLERILVILKDENPRDHLAEIAALRQWLAKDQFDRQAVNRRLQQYVRQDPAWQWEA